MSLMANPEARKAPDVLKIVGAILLLVAIATWFVPAGEFDRVPLKEGSTKKMIVPGTFKYVAEGNPQTWEVFLAPFKVCIQD